MMEWLKETLIGIVLMAICWLSYALYIRFTELSNEDNKRCKIAKIISKIGSGTLWTYIAICSFVGLIIGLIAMFT